MNKLPRSADCRPSGMIYLYGERRKSELRPVCLKIFAHWVEKYLGIQCSACLVWWCGWSYYEASQTETDL